MTYQVAVKLGTSSPIEAAQGNPVEGKDPKASNKVRDSPFYHCYETHKKIKVYNYNIYPEGLIQFHVDSLVGGAVSVSPCEPRLVDSVCFLC